MSAARSVRATTEVAPGVVFVEGPASNWTLLVGERSVTLVDAGYPADLPLVRESLRRAAAGRPLEAVLITHGHSDHIGSVRDLVAEGGVRVLAAADEIPNIRREVLHQVGLRQVLPRVLRYGVAPWALHAVSAGGMSDVAVAEVQPLTIGEPITTSGHTVIPLATTGHTPGHTAYDLPGAGIVITGDALVTGHPTSRARGIQSLHTMFHTDPAAAAIALRELAAMTGRTLLPGHGPLLRAADRA